MQLSQLIVPQNPHMGRSRHITRTIPTEGGRSDTMGGVVKTDSQAIFGAASRN